MLAVGRTTLGEIKVMTPDQMADLHRLAGVKGEMDRLNQSIQGRQATIKTHEANLQALQAKSEDLSHSAYDKFEKADQLQTVIDIATATKSNADAAKADADAKKATADETKAAADARRAATQEKINQKIAELRAKGTPEDKIQLLLAKFNKA